VAGSEVKILSRAWKSGRGLPQSKTLARLRDFSWRCRQKNLSPELTKFETRTGGAN
jgi:hypothetical protein